MKENNNNYELSPDLEFWEYNLTVSKEGDTAKLKVWGPDNNEGRWLLTYSEEEGDTEKLEFDTIDEVEDFIEELGFPFRKDKKDDSGSLKEFFPEIGDRHGDKPTFFRNIGEPDWEETINPAQYHTVHYTDKKKAGLGFGKALEEEIPGATYNIAVLYPFELYNESLGKNFEKDVDEIAKQYNGEVGGSGGGAGFDYYDISVYFNSLADLIGFSKALLKQVDYINFKFYDQIGRMLPGNSYWEVWNSTTQQWE